MGLKMGFLPVSTEVYGCVVGIFKQVKVAIISIILLFMSNLCIKHHCLGRIFFFQNALEILLLDFEHTLCLQLLTKVSQL